MVDEKGNITYCGEIIFKGSCNVPGLIRAEKVYAKKDLKCGAILVRKLRVKGWFRAKSYMYIASMTIIEGFAFCGNKKIVYAHNIKISVEIFVEPDSIDADLYFGNEREYKEELIQSILSILS